MPLWQWTTGQQEISTSWYPLTNSPHAVGLEWEASSSIGAEDGSLTLQIDGQQAEQLTGIDNDTLRVDSIKLGVLSASSAGISGSIYLDAFQSVRQGSLGLDPAIPVPPASGAILADTFESEDFSAWSGAVTDEGNLSVSEAASMEGFFGMEARGGRR